MKTNKCFYEIMGIQRNASEDDVKKAYRQLAMRHHPDRNQENVEEATEKFRELQYAYSILSNKQERAWYDEHRHQILNASNNKKSSNRGRHNGDDQDDDDQDDIGNGPELLNLWQFFSTGCYTTFSEEQDAEHNFFKVYGNVFSRIVDEEVEFCAVGRQMKLPVPQFGDSSTTSVGMVKRFYSYWESFTSRKSYSWHDEHNVLEAPNRLYRRAMERENEKRREEARKAYTELVRKLVRTVKERDPRWAHIEVQRKEAEISAAQQRQLKVQLRNAKLHESKRQTTTTHHHHDHHHLNMDQLGEGIENLDDDWENDIMAYYDSVTTHHHRHRHSHTHNVEEQEDGSDDDDNDGDDNDDGSGGDGDGDNGSDGDDNDDDDGGQEVDGMSDSGQGDVNDNEQGDVSDGEQNIADSSNSCFDSPLVVDGVNGHPIHAQPDEKEETNSVNVEQLEEGEESPTLIDYEMSKKKKRKQKKKGNIFEVEQQEKYSKKEEEEEALAQQEKKKKKKKSLQQQQEEKKKKNSQQQQQQQQQEKKKKNSQQQDTITQQETITQREPLSSKEQEMEPLVTVETATLEHKLSSSEKTNKANKIKPSMDKASVKSSKDKTPEVLLCHVCKESFTSRNKLFQHVKNERHESAYQVDEETFAGKSKKNKKKKK